MSEITNMQIIKEKNEGVRGVSIPLIAIILFSILTGCSSIREESWSDSDDEYRTSSYISGIRYKTNYMFSEFVRTELPQDGDFSGGRTNEKFLEKLRQYEYEVLGNDRSLQASRIRLAFSNLKFEYSTKIFAYFEENGEDLFRRYVFKQISSRYKEIENQPDNLRPIISAIQSEIDAYDEVSQRNKIILRPWAADEIIDISVGHFLIKLKFKEARAQLDKYSDLATFENKRILRDRIQKSKSDNLDLETIRMKLKREKLRHEMEKR